MNLRDEVDKIKKKDTVKQMQKLNFVRILS